MATIRDQFQTLLYLKDGEDHVNLSSGGNTTVGRMCSADWRRQFYIPHLGEFISIRAFVQWMATGDEASRMNPPTGRVSNMSSNDYHTLMLFAKYFQMTSFASTIRNEAALLDIPWVSYKQFGTGVRQHNVWTEYNLVVHEYADFIVNNTPKDMFPWDKLYPDVLNIVNGYLEEIVTAQGGTFVPFQELIAKGNSENRQAKPKRFKTEQRPRKNSFSNAGEHSFSQPQGGEDIDREQGQSNVTGDNGLSAEQGVITKADDTDSTENAPVLTDVIETADSQTTV